MEKLSIGNLLVIIFLLIIALISGYKSIIFIRDYIKAKNTIENLMYIKQVQSLEDAQFNEMTCSVTWKFLNDKFQKNCQEMSEATERLFGEIDRGNFDINLYTVKNNMKQFAQQLRKEDTYAIDAIKSGKLKKEIHLPIKRYIEHFKYPFNHPNADNIFALYIQLFDISYYLESEKILLSYYLSHKKPMNPAIEILWDSLISKSQIDDLTKKDIIKMVKPRKENSNQATKNIQQITRQIEEIRLDVMAHLSTGAYEVTLADWLHTANQKRKFLADTQYRLVNELINALLQKAQKSIKMAVAYAIVAIFALLGALYCGFVFRRSQSEKRYFMHMVSKIAALHRKESKNWNTNDMVTAASYIENRYEQLYKEKKQLEEQLKAMQHK